MRFEGKNAIVTGGGSGIGRATALRLAREGARVWIGDFNDAAGAAVAAEGEAGRISFQHCDVTRPDEIEALIAAADGEGGIDLLFNNAGSGGSQLGILDMTPEDWDRVQALLLRSVAMGITYGARKMRDHGRGGAIVNTASIAGVQSGAAMIGYSVAKAGVIHLTRLAAGEVSPHNIRVNAVCPGFIVTNIFTAAMELTGDAQAAAQRAIGAAAAKAQPVRRAGMPEDVAGLVTYLLSDDAGFITGEHVLVDGGMFIGPRHSWDPEAPNMLRMMAAGATGKG